MNLSLSLLPFIENYFVCFFFDKEVNIIITYYLCLLLSFLYCLVLFAYDNAAIRS